MQKSALSQAAQGGLPC